MNWFENLMNSYTVSGIMGDLKMQFRHKEIHELIDYFLKPALDDKDRYIEKAGFRGFTILSKVDNNRINVEIETFIHLITNVKIFLYHTEKNKTDDTDIEYIYEYEIRTDKDKEQITVLDNEWKITRDENNMTIKVEITSKIQKYINNNLRYEFLDINITDLMNRDEARHTTTETYIDLDNHAVRRELTYKKETPFDIKYFETCQFNANPFEDLYVISHSLKNNMKESTEDNFNEFLYGGNNKHLFL